MGNAKNGLIIQNEKEANLFVAKVIRISAVVFTLVLILNIVGIFIIEMDAMIIAYVSGILLLFIPTLITNILKKESPVNKYIYVTIAVLFVSILIVTLNWHAIIMFIFAIGIASMYFSKGVNRYAAMLSIVCFSIAQYIAFVTGFTPDANEQTLYRTIVFCIIPRAMCLFAVSEIFLNLNRRTTNMLQNLKNADEQARMVEQIQQMQNNAKEVSSTLSDAQRLQRTQLTVTVISH